MIVFSCNPSLGAEGLSACCDFHNATLVELSCPGCMSLEQRAVRLEDHVPVSFATRAPSGLGKGRRTSVAFVPANTPSATLSSILARKAWWDAQVDYELKQEGVKVGFPRGSEVTDLDGLRRFRWDLGADDGYLPTPMAVDVLLGQTWGHAPLPRVCREFTWIRATLPDGLEADLEGARGCPRAFLGMLLALSRASASDRTGHRTP